MVNHISEIINDIKSCWSEETAMNPDTWNIDNPSKDQCAVTAALIFELADIPVVRGIAHLPDGSTDSHYWNQGIDVTKDQYPDGTRIEIRDGPQGEEAYDYLLQNPDLVRRLDVLRKKYEEVIKNEADDPAI